MGGFLVIPALDILGGYCVQLERGDPSRILIKLPDPIGIAADFISRGAKLIHLVDLDAALYGSGRNLDLITQICSRFRVQLGGGIRDYSRAKHLLDSGAYRIILGTAAFQNPEIVSRLSREYSPSRIMIGMDIQSGRITIKARSQHLDWDPISAASLFKQLGAGSILYTDVSREGLALGPDIDFLSEFISSVDLPVYVAGGICKISQIRQLRSMGAAGVILGIALYRGWIKLESALKLEKLEEFI